MKATYLELKTQIDAAYHRVMDGGWYILGAETESLEREFAAWCGAQHCVAVGNGLEALHLILRAQGIGQGDEVIVPANTFIATWLAVSSVGATPVPVEPDAANLQHRPEQDRSRHHAATRARSCPCISMASPPTWMP